MPTLFLFYKGCFMDDVMKASTNPTPITNAQDFVTTLGMASSYMSRGWNIFPAHAIAPDGMCTCRKIDCKDLGKHPAVKSWKSAATVDIAKAQNWWSLDSKFLHNIGIATGKVSGITVIDIDTKNNGLETWQDICAKYDIPNTYTVKTGSGGLHLYFKYCKDVPNSTNTYGSGIDTRNDGGYIIAPPSNHKSGGSYAVIADVPLADFPDDLLKAKAPAPRIKDAPVSKSISLERAELFLDYIPNNDYSTWFKVGIILGRIFDRSDDAWQLYQKWSDKNYDGAHDSNRANTMRDAFYRCSQQQARDGKNLNANSLQRMAEKNGYTDIKNVFDIRLFCYLASENAFIFLPNGDKWIASSVDGTIPYVVTEWGEKIKASTWLIQNKAAVNLISDGNLPNGLIEGYFSKEGMIIPLDKSRILNLFNQGHVFPSHGLALSKNEVPDYDEDLTVATYECPDDLAKALMDDCLVG